MEVELATGKNRNLIDERSSTFIWTAHAENADLRPINWLEKTDELIYVSERDGWRHLYLVDAAEGAIKHPITKGDYVVRGTKVASVMRTTPLRVELTVPGQYISTIAAGRRWSVTGDRGGRVNAAA